MQAEPATEPEMATRVWGAASLLLEGRICKQGEGTGGARRAEGKHEKSCPGDQRNTREARREEGDSRRSQKSTGAEQNIKKTEADGKNKLGE